MLFTFRPCTSRQSIELAQTTNLSHFKATTLAELCCCCTVFKWEMSAQIHTGQLSSPIPTRRWAVLVAASIFWLHCTLHSITPRHSSCHVTDTGRLVRPYTLAIHRRTFGRPWVTTTRSIARPLCDSWASCLTNSY